MGPTAKTSAKRRFRPTCWKQRKKRRAAMLESLSMYSDELMEKLLGEEEVAEELIHDITRSRCDQAGVFVPCSSARHSRTKACNRLLDAITRYLPSPPEIKKSAMIRTKRVRRSSLNPIPTKPFVGDGVQDYGRRVRPADLHANLPGKMEKGEQYYNQRTGKKERFARIVRMHSDKREEIECAEAGDIVAIMGIDCASGDTYCEKPEYCSLENIFVADPVIKMSIQPDVTRQCRQAGQGAATFPQGRPHLPRDDRRRNERNGHRRHGRVAPGSVRRADQARVRRRSRVRVLQRSVTANRPQPFTSSITSAKSRRAVPVNMATSSARWAR